MRLIKLQSKNCQPCNQLQKLLDCVSPLDRPATISYDVFDYPEVAKKYNIRAVPVLILEDNEGKELKRISGLPTVKELQSFLNL